MYGGGKGINRLNFITEVMNGTNPYAHKQHWGYRMEFAADLAIRADALKGLGEREDAAKAMKRAVALAYPSGPRAALSGASQPSRYVDLVRVETEPQEPAGTP